MPGGRLFSPQDSDFIALGINLDKLFSINSGKGAFVLLFEPASAHQLTRESWPFFGAFRVNFADLLGGNLSQISPEVGKGLAQGIISFPFGNNVLL